VPEISGITLPSVTCGAFVLTIQYAVVPGWMGIPVFLRPLGSDSPWYPRAEEAAAERDTEL